MNNSDITTETKSSDTNATETKAETTTETATVDTKEETTTVVEDNPQNDDFGLKYIDKDFLYECMSVPTYSKEELRMVVFIILWARRNNIKYEFDKYGNVYLTKGELAENEYYPCVTSHLDTVQTKHIPYIKANVPLDIITTRIVKNEKTYHKMAIDAKGGSSIGIGADDKGGVAICLSIFSHVDKLKACFFLDEETGCNGSKNLDEEWFKNVGYVIGFDSPELTRAAWSCSGTKLFSYKFYEEHMKEICDKWGLTKGHFFSEPFTDVKNIREKIGLICMNFGNGGYEAHQSTEYCLAEEMDSACGMGTELIQSIGCTRHYLEHKSSFGATTYTRQADGTYAAAENDEAKLRELGDNNRYSSRYYGGTASTYKPTTTVSSVATVKKEDEIKFETVKYIVNRYESHIDGIKNDVLDAIEELCKTKGVDFADFEKAINLEFSNEIKF